MEGADRVPYRLRPGAGGSHDTLKDSRKVWRAVGAILVTIRGC